MYLTAVIYVLCIVLILWGGKFAGLKGDYHDDFMSLETTKALRGLAALFVIFHHISQEAAFQNKGVMSAFVNAGPKLVAIFFFCSGYGLMRSLDTKPEYLKGFLKKRVGLGILLPFYVNIVLYAIYFLIAGYELPGIRWITNFLGLTMMNEYAWFPIVLTILYVAFYLAFKNIKNHKLSFLVIFVVVILMGVWFCVEGHFAWWAGDKNWWLKYNGYEKAKWWMLDKVFWFSGEWWVNSAIGFFIGIIFGDNEEKIVNWFRKKYWLKLVIAIILANAFNFFSLFVQGTKGYYAEWSGNGPGITEKFLTYLSQIPQITMFLVVICLVMMKFNTSNPVLRFFGKYSLDTYLMNLLAITEFRFLIMKNDSPYYKTGAHNLTVYLVCVLAATIVMGMLEYHLINRIKSIIGRK